MVLRALLPLATLTVLGGTLTACLAPEETDPPRATRVAPGGVGASSDAIKDGYDDDFDHAVVAIFEAQQGGICSGSLIAPNLVLTARHCVSRTLGDDTGVHCLTTRSGPPFAPEAFYVTTRAVMSDNPAHYRGVVEVVGLPVADDLFCGQDMALLILEENVPPEEATPYVPRVDSALASGEEYYAVGYGNTNETSGAGKRRRRDGLFVDCAEEGCGERAYLRVTEWIGDTGICSGDSGGPAIDLLNRVVGVTSRGAYDCDDPVYGSTHGWGQWLKDTAARAATMGNYPPAPWVTGAPTDPAYNHPVGAACTESANCPSGICWNGACTRVCGELGPCPEGYTCEAPPEAGGGQVCLPPPAPPTPEEPEDEDEGEDASAASGGANEGDGATADEGGCSIGAGVVREKDPVTPVPWLIGAAATLMGLARRRGSRSRR